MSTPRTVRLVAARRQRVEVSRYLRRVDAPIEDDQQQIFGISPDQDHLSDYEARLVWPTTLSNVTLRTFTSRDLDAYYGLLQASADHLTALGDYLTEVARRRDEWRSLLASPPGGARFGVWLGNDLAGEVAVLPVAPPRFGFGYWIGAPYARRGLMTVACGAAVVYAQKVLGATDIYAGVTHGNVRSERLLERLGFARSERFDTYDRFHLPLSKTA